MTRLLKEMPALLFGAGLLLIAVDCFLFLFDWRHAGVAFCSGMAICMLTAILFERLKREETLVLMGAASFFIWLAYKSL